jgi:hypothetical protein
MDVREKLLFHKNLFTTGFKTLAAPTAGNDIFGSPASLRVGDDPAIGRFEIRRSLTRLFFKAS